MGEPHEVIPGLFIGDYATSQNLPLLAKAGISNLVAAMRQDYDTPLTVHRVPVDDTSSTNIIAHFPATIHFIRDCRARNAGGVLVHCQAGVSRSTTLVAAFLMAELGLDVEQAVDKVRQVRSQVEPTEFFLHQLEMFERCECEWDPVKWIEQRRFLMGFAQAQIMDGTSPSIVLAYYPSPSPSPKSDPHSGGLTMTSLEQVSSTLLRTESGSSSSTIDVPTLVNGDSDGLGESATTTTTAAPLAPTDPPARKRLTAKGAGKVAETKPADPEKNSVENVGTKGQVVVVGKRIRCKMCRRELAARDHIIVHEPGKGQQAFAPHRRDMNAHRAELERRRLDEIDREKREAADEVKPSMPTVDTSLPPALAGLRIAKPLVGVAGLRVAVPRPRPPVARPTPSSSSSTPSTTTPSESTDTPLPLPSSSEPEPPTTIDSPSDDPPAPTPGGPTSPDLPLLPSHLCSSYFVEPLSWMSPLLESGVLSGKIVCPGSKCGAKLGSFDWAGLQCSCGAWVLPGFALNVSRVDEYKPGVIAALA